MKSAFLPCLVLAVLAVAGCSQERSRAVNEPASAKEKDYRQMVDRVRNRQTSQRSLELLQDGVRNFHRDIGRLPTNIVELVIRRYVSAIPSLPPGQQFYYDPVHGNVNIAQVSAPMMNLPPAPDLTNRASLAPQRP